MARIWSAADGAELRRLRHDDTVFGAAWNQAETLILTWSADNSARLWSAADGIELLRLNHADNVFGAAWNAAETAILTRSADNTVRVWSAVDGSELLRLEHDARINGATWNEADATILTWSDDNTARVWSASDGSELLRLAHDDDVYGATWNDDQTAILTLSGNPFGAGMARVWSAAEGQLLLTLLGDGTLIRSAKWNKGETAIMLATQGGNVRVYATQMSELLDHNCAFATRNLTWDEFRRYLPGQPYHKTCAHLPVHCSVPANEWPADYAEEINLCPAE
jgi:hypothetical protein